uniref:Uncharacterized protein n=1 Tax=viral metagenome TaxID=1070528 RepID=A0A6C0BVT2_9ZZZZ
MAKNLTLAIKDECSLSCEITCDFEQGGNLTNTVGGSGKMANFLSDSGKLKIHYGGVRYLIKGFYFYESIHTALYKGTRREIMMSCQAPGEPIPLVIFLPITEGTSNKNGKTMVALSNPGTQEKPITVADFERIFPLDTPYIMYTTSLPMGGGGQRQVQCVVISEANIVIGKDDVGTSLPPDAFRESIITYVMRNMGGIKKGPVGANRIETIECLPINDNGILLTDVEKGLGDSNITSRFNFSEIIARALKIPALRIIGGAASVIVLYKIMSMMAKKKNVGLKKMSEINN